MPIFATFFGRILFSVFHMAALGNDSGGLKIVWTALVNVREGLIGVEQYSGAIDSNL